MKLGYTGTRRGMTISQWGTIQDLMTELWVPGKRNEWHDGDAIGGDDQAHKSAEMLKSRFSTELHGHPCNKPDQRAFNDFDFLHEIKAPLVRNRDMVNVTETFLAAPYEYKNVPRGSGTWATIRYCAQVERVTWLVWPNGKAELLVERKASLFD